MKRVSPRYNNTLKKCGERNKNIWWKQFNVAVGFVHKSLTLYIIPYLFILFFTHQQCPLQSPVTCTMLERGVNYYIWRPLHLLVLLKASQIALLCLNREWINLGWMFCFVTITLASDLLCNLEVSFFFLECLAQ
jgi:hypothetical protein